MTEQILEILNKILIFDLIFIVLIILSLIKCTSKGFVFYLKFLKFVQSFILMPKGFIKIIRLGSKVKTSIIASSIAIPVKIPK